MYKKFKIVVIFIISNFFFLTSCQNEDLTEETKQQELDIAIQRKNFNAFRELPELVSKHLAGNSSETFSRDINKDPLYDFDIDSTSVTQIVKDGKTFYTLAIYRENREDNSFENLVISKDGSNNEAYIIKYFPSPEYYQNLKTNIHTHFIGGIDVTTLDYNQLMSRGERSCYTVTIAYCGNGLAGTLAGPRCYKHSDGGAHVFTRSYSVCEELPDDLTYISPDIPQTDSGGGGTVSPLNPIVTEPILVFSERHFVMGLSPEQKAWWDDSANAEAKQDILNYLQQNQTEESELFVEQLIDLEINGNLLSFFPTFKYPAGSNYSTQYPKLTEYLKNKIPELKNNPLIINKLVQYSELSSQQVINDLKWGQGPTIQIAQLDSRGVNCYGIFSSATPNVLTIDIDFVNLLENSTPGPGGDSLAFLLGVTILHEYVHLGDFVDGIDQTGEEGLLFEQATYGETIWLNNAGEVLIKWQ